MGAGVGDRLSLLPQAGRSLPTAERRVFAARLEGRAALLRIADRPAAAPCPLFDQSKAAKSGSVIPIKLQLCDADGANVSSSAIGLRAQGVSLVSSLGPGTLADAGNANPDNDFHYDAALGGTGGYIFNLSTQGLGRGTYRLRFTVGDDPAVYAVEFQVK